MTTGLERLFRPKSIAVIGGGAWCANVIQQCKRMGYAGDLWAVHPSRLELEGVAAYPSIDALPCAPDAAFVGVNRNATIEVVSALRLRKAGGAVCFANGFREAASEASDGKQLQDDLIAAAGDMTIVGPNCYGFINYLDGALLWPDQHGGGRVDSGVAIITQSSNIAVNLTMQARGLPVAYVVTAGNQAQTGFAEIGAALLRDERVTVLGLHVEGFGNLRQLEQLATIAKECRKQIVVIKVGQSDEAQAATISHTASLAGTGAGARALVDRLGWGHAETLSEFLETLKLLHVVGPLESASIASMSCSGGEASLMADLAMPTKLRFPPLNSKQQGNLRKALGPMVKLANPLDYNTHIWPDTDRMAETFTAIMDRTVAFGLVVLDFPRADRCDASDWDNVIDAVEIAQKRSGRPIGIVASIPENLPEEIAHRLIAKGIVPLSGMAEAVLAVETAATIRTEAKISDRLLLPKAVLITDTMSETEAKSALATFGAQVPRSRFVNNADSVGEAAKELKFPVVLKGSGVAHKTENGGVILELASPEEVVQAAAGMNFDNFLVEEMVADNLAELLVGVVLDPAHGYVLTIGAGGQLTELLEDRVSLLLPTDKEQITNAIEQLRIYPLLKGHRGAPPVNLAAVVDNILAVQNYVVAQQGQVSEVEINPLICGQIEAVAADALIIVGVPDV